MIAQIKCPDNIYAFTSTIGSSVDYEYGFHLNTLNHFLFPVDGNQIEAMGKFSKLATPSMIFSLVIPQIVDELLKHALTNTT